MSSVADRSAAISQRPGGGERRPAADHGHRYLPLLYRIAGINVLLVIAAVGVTIVVLAPGRISTLAQSEEAAVVLAAVAFVGVANVLLLRRVVGPVQALTAFARRVDYSKCCARRRPSGCASPRSCTIRLDRSSPRCCSGFPASAGACRRTSAKTSSQFRTPSATAWRTCGGSLSSSGRRRSTIWAWPARSPCCASASRGQLDLDVAGYIAPDLPPLPAEVELVVYRVAQEVLTNVARHSASSRAELTLGQSGSLLILRVGDYGLGLPAGGIPGTGMRGMQERAALIGASLTIGNRRAGSGCEVRLEVPLGERR